MGSSWSEDGADILDVGGESTRPGAEEVGAEEEIAQDGAGGLRPRRPRPHGLDRHLEAGGRRGGARRRRGDRQRRHRAARRPRDRRALRRARRRPDPHAHAGRPAHDAGRTRPTTTSSTTSGPSSPSGSRSALAAGVAERADLGRPGHRLRQDPRAQPRAAAPARRAARRSAAARRRHLAQELHRQDRRLGRRATRIGGTIASSVLAAAEGADVLRVHDVAEVAQAVRVATAILG